MSDVKKAETSAKKDKAVKGDMIDPMATSPSRDPNAKDREGTSTATEPNSTQRVGKKVSRTGHGNGGGATGNDALRTRLGVDPTADTLGERKTVSPAETDVIWTNESKDKWGRDQPGLGELLNQRNAIAKQQAEEER